MTDTTTPSADTPESVAARLRDSMADPDCTDWTCPECGRSNLKGCVSNGKWVDFRRECDDCGFDASAYDLSPEARAITEAQAAEIARLSAEVERLSAEVARLAVVADRFAEQARDDFEAAAARDIGAGIRAVVASQGER